MNENTKKYPELIFFIAAQFYFIIFSYINLKTAKVKKKTKTKYSEAVLASVWISGESITYLFIYFYSYIFIYLIFSVMSFKWDSILEAV